MGVGWCGEVADAEAALEHSTQAVRYLLVGKDDCVRKATKVRPALHCSPEPLSPGLSRESAAWQAACYGPGFGARWPPENAAVLLHARQNYRTEQGSSRGHYLEDHSDAMAEVCMVLV